MTKNDFICQYVMRLAMTERQTRPMNGYPDPDWLLKEATKVADKLEAKKLFTKLTK